MENGKVFPLGNYSRAATSLPTSLNLLYVNLYQPASQWKEESKNLRMAGEGRERGILPTLFWGKTPVWIDGSLFKNEQRKPTYGFRKARDVNIGE